MILEGALSFVGLGVPPPAPSWGNMIAQGQSTLSAEPRYVFLPSIALFITVVSLNLLGEGCASPLEQPVSATSLLEGRGPAGRLPCRRSTTFAPSTA